ncbi:MAG: LPS-assembly lipoprotein [Halieaceae bacterium]|jgi:LPS-assembly lipoprotein
MMQPLTHLLSRLTMVVGLSLFIAGCGFQLRGKNTATALPPSWQQMNLVTANPNSEFSRAIQARFSANGIIWVGKDEAAYILILGPEGFSQRNLSLNAEARAAEFELTMKTNFSVLAVNGTEEIGDSGAVVIKQMENDPRNVVGKSEEIRILKTEMRNELAQQIMRRIGFYAASTQ